MEERPIDGKSGVKTAAMAPFGENIGAQRAVRIGGYHSACGSNSGLPLGKPKHMEDNNGYDDSGGKSSGRKHRWSC